MNGLIFTSLFVTALSNMLRMSQQDQKSYDLISRLKVKSKMKHLAALSISKFFRILKYQREGTLGQHRRLIF